MTHGTADEEFDGRHLNADHRIRQAFDVLRAEVADIFGPTPTEAPSVLSADASHFMAGFHIDQAQDRLHRFAKLPADA